jgi:hypothetical protein
VPEISKTGEKEAPAVGKPSKARKPDPRILNPGSGRGNRQSSKRIARIKALAQGMSDVELAEWESQLELTRKVTASEAGKLGAAANNGVDVDVPVTFPPITSKHIRCINRLQPTMKEMAAYFGCSEQTLDDALRADPDLIESIKQGRAEGSMGLRRAQFRLLEQGLEPGGDTRAASTMAIWLGKQVLGQADRSVLETRWQGRLEDMDDETLVALAQRALQVLEPGQVVLKIAPKRDGEDLDVRVTLPQSEVSRPAPSSSSASHAHQERDSEKSSGDEGLSAARTQTELSSQGSQGSGVPE